MSDRGEGGDLFDALLDRFGERGGVDLELPRRAGSTKSRPATCDSDTFEETAVRRAAAGKRILNAATMPVGEPGQTCAELSELRGRPGVTKE